MPPILFTLINNLDKIYWFILLYADHTTRHFTTHNPPEIERFLRKASERLNADLSLISNWDSKNALLFVASKLNSSIFINLTRLSRQLFFPLLQ